MNALGFPRGFQDRLSSNKQYSNQVFVRFGIISLFIAIASPSYCSVKSNILFYTYRHKVLEDVVVECRSQQFASRTPFARLADQQAFADPSGQKGVDKHLRGSKMEEFVQISEEIRHVPYKITYAKN